MATLAELRTPHLVSNEKTAGEATKAELLGRLDVPETPLDAAANFISMKFDITDHLDGHAGTMSATIEISLDDRKTWRHLAGVARDKGYAPDDLSDAPSDIGFLSVGLPEVGNPRRWMRGHLVVEGQPVTTNFELVPVELRKVEALAAIEAGIL